MQEKLINKLTELDQRINEANANLNLRVVIEAVKEVFAEGKNHEEECFCGNDHEGHIHLRPESWEVEFDKQFSNVGFIPENKQRHLDFIKQTLSKREAEIREKIEQHFYGANDVKVKDILSLLQPKNNK